MPIHGRDFVRVVGSWCTTGASRETLRQIEGENKQNYVLMNFDALLFLLAKMPLLDCIFIYPSCRPHHCLHHNHDGRWVLRYPTYYRWCPWPLNHLCLGKTYLKLLANVLTILIAFKLTQSNSSHSWCFEITTTTMVLRYLTFYIW